MATLLDTERDQEERDNFFRLTLLLFRLGNTKVREYLKSKWPAVYLTANPGSTCMPAAWKDTPADATSLKTISKPKFMFKDQQTTFDSGNTNEWDFTLLRLVLATYPLGFVVKPSAEDDALEDMRVIRNTLICHASDARISNVVFNTEWPKACRALGRFSATQDEIDAVEEDVKKPIDTLMPLLKECIKSDYEILASITEFEKKAEEQHKDVMETLDRHHDENMNAMKEEGRSIRKAIEESNKPKSPEIRHLLLPEDQRLLLQQRLPNFQDDVIATDLLDNLPCLTQEQKDQIAYDEKNFQTSKGVRTLVEKLEEHEEGFGQFVQALGKADLGHVAVILDPDFKNHVEEEEEDIPHFSIDGTAADAPILVRIWNALDVRQIDLEERVASQFEKSSTSESRKLRRYFEKELPEGVFFVHTTQLGGKNKNAGEKTKDNVTRSKKDSIVFVFRLAKVKALDDLWNMYSDQTLTKKLTEVLTSRVLIKDPCKEIKLETLFQEKDYMERREKLKGPEPIEESELSVEGIGAALIDSDATGTEIPLHSHRSLSRVYLGDIPQNELQLREYQKELAAPALEGKNTIICAPTNSGKTFVAMEIAKRHLDAYKDSKEATSHNRNPKVIFAVNKQNLVLQQRVRFEEYLANYNISDISGNNSDRTPLQLLIQDNDVIVLTAQILVNALENKSVDITDISLLVFDECHHANGDEPYNMIMKTYLKTKLNENDKGNLPQVVGLTASLGVGQSIEKDKAKEHILQICANLDASYINTVRENIDELTMNVTGSFPNREVITVNNDVPNIFELEINKAMKEIEGFINNTGTYCPPPTTDRQITSYRQWIEELSKHASIQNYSDNFLCGEHLRSYHEALLINNAVRIDDAMTYLENFYTKRDQSKLTDTGSWLQNLYQKTKQLVEKHKQEAPENPLLETLRKQIIVFHEKEKESGAKGILFAQTRDYTVALKKWVNETKELNEILKPDILVGSGDSEIGLTQSQQESVIKKFKNGDINIIIATTVAEEGLDISDCCYVIRYCVKTNEISSVQSRGRIRAKEGNYVYIGDSRSRGADHELRNEVKEKMMHSVVEEVRDMNQEEFANEIKCLQIRSISELQAKEEIEASKPGIQDIPGGVTFYCRGGCKELVCHAQDMRLFKGIYRVVMDPSIYERSDIKQHTKPRQVDEVTVNKKIHCKKCDFDWGIVITVAGSDWPCLKIESLIIEFNDTKKRQLLKKWKKFPFTIPKAEVAELNDARRRLMECSVKQTETVKSLCCCAN